MALAATIPLLAHDPVTTKLTWSQEISRIFMKRCASCHREGGNAPMALQTYTESRPWAKAIKEEVLSRRMPPWGAVRGFGQFAHDESLTQDEMMRIAEWVEGGAPEGDPNLLPVSLPRSTSAITERRVRKIRGPVTLLGIRPEQDVREEKIVATFPDGHIEPLLWLRDYDRSWNRTFVLREPLHLPAGTKIQHRTRLEFVIKAAPRQR